MTSETKIRRSSDSRCTSLSKAGERIAAGDEPEGIQTGNVVEWLVFRFNGRTRTCEGNDRGITRLVADVEARGAEAGPGEGRI